MNDKSKLIIAFQGMAGAYSNMACEAYFPSSKTLACNSFEDMLCLLYTSDAADD